MPQLVSDLGAVCKLYLNQRATYQPALPFGLTGRGMYSVQAEKFRRGSQVRPLHRCAETPPVLIPRR
jgi:hypothetical protein